MASRYWCKVCKRFVDTNLKKKHLASKKHLFNVHDKLREIGLKEREKERLMKLAEDEVGGDDIKHTSSKLKGIRKSNRNGKGARSASHRNGSTVKSIESSIKNRWVEVTRDNDKSNVEATGVRIRKVSAYDKKLNDWDFQGDDDNEDEDSDEDDDKKQPIRFKIRGRKVRK